MDGLTKLANEIGHARDYGQMASAAARKLLDIVAELNAQRMAALSQQADEIWAMVAERYVELPKDAGGEPIRVGDKVTCARSVWQVTGLRLTGLAWGVCCTIFNDHGGSGTNVYPPCDLRHYHKPTVEEVLTEFGIDWEHESDCEDRAALLKEYASKLRLAEGEDA